MKDRIVPQEEVEQGYIAFCKDLGVNGETKEDIDQYLQEHNIIIEKKEDKTLIWFEQIEKGEVKYYSQPIMKYIQEFYYDEGKLTSNFTKVVNERSLNKLVKLINKDKLAFGGNVTDGILEPTVLEDVSLSD